MVLSTSRFQIAARVTEVLSWTQVLCRKKSIKPPLYKVLLHNDNSNKREYVVKVLLKVVDGLTVDDAVHVMNEAHLQARTASCCRT